MRVWRSQMSKKKFRVYVSQPQWLHGQIEIEAYTIEEVLAMLEEEDWEDDVEWNDVEEGETEVGEVMEL